MKTGPDFIIIGAMKCATSTLHDQLARQPGLYMSRPKEPNYFSNDEVYALGQDWYAGLYKDAPPGAICGESSTHYTKLPTYPHTLERMASALKQPRLIYMMKHPVERLVSHYMHAWSEREISVDIDSALALHPELIAYSCYDRQLAPFVTQYGREAILPLFVPFFEAHPEDVLNLVAQHVGLAPSELHWHHEVGRSNASAERLRMGPVLQWVVNNPVLQSLRRGLVPQSLRTVLKAKLQMRNRPILSAASMCRLRETFDEDLSRLGKALGVTLDCANFDTQTRAHALRWQREP